MGALHEVNASYYGTTRRCAERCQLGHPSDEWGWAAGFGLKINTPFITQGDWFQTQVNVTEGALRYLFNTPNTNYGMANGTNAGFGNEGYGVLSDCVYGGTVAGGNYDGLPADLGLGLQRRLRALLDPGVAHQLVRRLVPGEVRCQRQRDAVLGSKAGGNGVGHGLDSCCGRRLQQQLVDLGRRLAHAVGRHQDVLPGRRGAVLGSA